MVKFICDGCGKEDFGHCDGRAWFKPKHWYSKKHERSKLHACSRECVKTIALKYDVTDVVLPF